MPNSLLHNLGDFYSPGSTSPNSFQLPGSKQVLFARSGIDHNLSAQDLIPPHPLLLIYKWVLWAHLIFACCSCFSRGFNTFILTAAFCLIIICQSYSPACINNSLQQRVART